MARGIEINGKRVGAEAAIAAMDEHSYTNIGRSTYRFVRRCQMNPELWARVQKRAAEIREQEENGIIYGGT